MWHKIQVMDTSSENQGKSMRYSAAYPTGAERFCVSLLCQQGLTLLTQ